MCYILFVNPQRAQITSHQENVSPPLPTTMALGLPWQSFPEVDIHRRYGPSVWQQILGRHRRRSEESYVAKSSKSRDVFNSLCHTRYAHKIKYPAKYYLHLSRDCNVFNKKAAVKGLFANPLHSLTCSPDAFCSTLFPFVRSILTHSSILALSQMFSPTRRHLFQTSDNKGFEPRIRVNALARVSASGTDNYLGNYKVIYMACWPSKLVRSLFFQSYQNSVGQMFR